MQELGGHITTLGVPRVNGVLAISRAIGDVDYKRFLISDPEFKSSECHKCTHLCACMRGRAREVTRMGVVCVQNEDIRGNVS